MQPLQTLGVAGFTRPGAPAQHLAHGRASRRRRLQGQRPDPAARRQRADVRAPGRAGVGRGRALVPVDPKVKADPKAEAKVDTKIDPKATPDGPAQGRRRRRW